MLPRTAQEREHFGPFRQADLLFSDSLPREADVRLVRGFLPPGRPFSRPGPGTALFGRFSGCKMLSSQRLRVFHVAAPDKIPEKIREFVEEIDENFYGPRQDRNGVNAII